MNQFERGMKTENIGYIGYLVGINYYAKEIKNRISARKDNLEM